MTPEEIALHRLGMKLKFAYSVCGLLLGLVCILTGLALGLAGVAGHTNFTASLLGLNTQLTDAAPGVVVFVVGIFMVFISRFKVLHKIEEFPHQGSPRTDSPIVSPPATTPGGGGGGGGGSGRGFFSREKRGAFWGRQVVAYNRPPESEDELKHL